MSFPDPITGLYLPNDGDDNTVTLLTAYLLELAGGLYSPPAARVYHNASQSVANITLTALALNSERFDTDTMHDTATNNSRLTCKTAGLYEIKGCAAFATSAVGNVRALQIRLNGVTDLGVQYGHPIGGGALSSIITVSTLYELAVNDYVQLMAYQDSGGALNVLSGANYSPEFMCVKVG
jgi:hypothetical protein